jgi:hypothetical protein
MNVSIHTQRDEPFAVLTPKVKFHSYMPGHHNTWVWGLGTPYALIEVLVGKEHSELNLFLNSIEHIDSLIDALTIARKEYDLAVEASTSKYYDAVDPERCEGHPASEFDPMGETVYCDGSCREER